VTRGTTTPAMAAPSVPDPAVLKADLAARAAELGFTSIGVARPAVPADEHHLLTWLSRGRHGTMDWMARHHARRADANAVIPGTLRVVSLAMDYWPGDAREPWSVLLDPTLGYVSRYALGRDYHKLVRARLASLATWLADAVAGSRYRVFVDSGPLLERAFAREGGLGWFGKHTCLIDRERGSLFFLGEILTDLPLPLDRPFTSDHCGTCTACLDVCPTGAIVAPREVDARLCISYLTIEHEGPIPTELRPAIGNRIFGCDDCQLVCPWNRYATPSREADFAPRHGLDAPDLVALLEWDRRTFERLTEGSALRRTGHRGWLRNVAVALGNALFRLPAGDARVGRIVAALERRRVGEDALVAEHAAWALDRAPPDRTDTTIGRTPGD